MDIQLIENLPISLCGRYNAIIVFVCRLSKMVMFPHIIIMDILRLISWVVGYINVNRAHNETGLHIRLKDHQDNNSDTNLSAPSLKVDGTPTATHTSLFPRS